MGFDLEKFAKLEDLAHASCVKHAEEMLGYRFRAPGLLEAALTHPSASKKGHTGYGYERLEFLGDSILGALVARKVFVAYPDIDEGGLTRIKVALVSGDTLSEVSRKLGLAECIIFGESEMGTGARGLHRALENVYEAVVAALYLDGGVKVAAHFVDDTLGPYMNKSIADAPESPKSTLQELLQAHHREPRYEIVDEDGPAHDRVFYARVYDADKVIGEGSGRSKKAAEAAAAAAALEKFKNE